MPDPVALARPHAKMGRTVVSLRSTRCALCETPGNATELYPARLPTGAFNRTVFSARRPPDRIHYRLVRCRTCGLVRSDPTAAESLVNALYARSRFTYAAEAGNLRRTYGRYLARTRRWAAPSGSLLEVGCGNGFFLEEALRRGFRPVVGVEPGRDAVARAPSHLRPHIRNDILRPGLLPPGRFDRVCLFQVLDHIAEPGDFLAECFRLLRPGGVVLCLNHNVETLSARLLGERSPIIDVEHPYLYSPMTLRALFERAGFEVCEAGPVWNRYSLGYFAGLLPVPASVRWAVHRLLAGTGLHRLPAWLPLGNQYLIARKPAPGREATGRAGGG